MGICCSLRFSGYCTALVGSQLFQESFSIPLSRVRRNNSSWTAWPLSSLTVWTLKMELLDCPETSVSNYQAPLRYIAGGRRTPVHCGGSLKTKTDLLHFLWDQTCAFAKLRKSTSSFVMSICSSILLCFGMEQLGFHWAVFHEVRYLRF